MKHPSYKAYLHDIQQQVKDPLIYSFIWLAMRTPDKPWAIDRRTLRRARNAGELLCNTPTTVPGRYLKVWAFKTPRKRKEFAETKLAKEFAKKVRAA